MINLNTLDNVLGGNDATNKKTVAPTSNTGVNRLSSLDNVLAPQKTEAVKPVAGTYTVDKTGAFKDTAGNTFKIDTNLGDGSTLSKGSAPIEKVPLLTKIARAILPDNLENAFGIAPESEIAKDVRITGTQATIAQMNKTPAKVSNLEYLKRGISFGNELDPTNALKGYQSDVSVTDLPEPITIPQKVAQAIGGVITMTLAQPLIEAGVGSLIGSTAIGAKFLNGLKTATEANPWTLGYGAKILESAGTGGLFGLITNNRQSVAKNVIDTAGTFAAFTALAYPVAQFFKPIITSVGKMEVQNENLKGILNDPQVTQPTISKTVWFKNPKNPTQLLKVTANGMEFTSAPAGEIVESGVKVTDIPTITSVDVEAFQTKPSVYQNLKEWISGKIPAKNVPFSVTDTMPKDTIPVDDNMSTVETPEAQAYKTSVSNLDSATSAQVRTSLNDLETKLTDLRGNETVNPQVQTALIGEINATRDAFNAYNAANKEVVLSVTEKNHTLAHIEIVEYSDGKYSVGVNAGTTNSGIGSPFDGEYNTREEAITAGKATVQRFVDGQRNNATPSEIAQLKKIESALGTTKIAQNTDITIKNIETTLNDFANPNATSDPHDIQEIKNSIAEGKMLLKAGTINGRKLLPDEMERISNSIESAQSKIGAERIDEQTTIQEISSDQIFNNKFDPTKDDLTKEGLKKWKSLVKQGKAQVVDGRYSIVESAPINVLPSTKGEISNAKINHTPTNRKLPYEVEYSVHGSTVHRNFTSEEKAQEWIDSRKKSQKELVKEAVKEAPKSIKQVSEETKILEPNVRRILGVGAKDGTFERVDNGVYILKNVDGKDIAYIQAGDAREVLPKLAKDGLKADMIFLDIPYETAGVTGGNRGAEFSMITPKEFGDIIVPAIKQIARGEDSAIVYMYSNSKSGMKQMLEYNTQILNAGLQVVAKGTYSKTYKDGSPMKFGKYPMPPEGILIFNKSGKDIEMPKAFDIQAVAPLYRGHYQTEKAPELLRAIINGTSKVGDTVLDPFAGSGVTGSEAIKAGRIPNLIEKNAEVVENIIKPRVRQAVKETLKINDQIKSLQGEVGLGADKDGNFLTEKELKENGEAIQTLKEDKIKTGKKFIEEQNGLYLEPSNEIKPLINGKKVETEKPLLSKTAVQNLLKNNLEFKKNPTLTVATKKGGYDETDRKILTFKGEKTSFSIYPSAFGLVEANLIDGMTIKINPETFKAVGMDRVRVNEYKAGEKQAGSFASMDKFRETMEPIERVIDNVKPIEFPELVRLTRELTGTFPKIKLPRFRPSMGGRPWGLFYPRGDGSIVLNPEIFKEGNEDQATKTLAHEIGHLIDYLPEHTMARGNILGRLAVLKNFGKDFYTEIGVTRTNTEMKRELWALSKYWKPVDEEALKGTSYLKYRQSAPEIYADFISVLFNDPKLAQDMAPESYNTFFKTLDKKPEVKTAYFELQDLLSGSTEDLMKARQEDIRKGFARGEDLQAGFQAKREAKITKFWERLRQQLDDTNYPILKKQQMAEAAGHVFTEENNPRFILQEQSLADNENFVLVDTIDNEIVKPIEKAGMIIEDIGEYLLLDRIINERTDIANPFGFNTKNAPKQMDFLKKTVGEKNFALLEEKVQAFHDLAFQSVEEAVKVGSYNTEIFNTKIKPNKNHYASFQVIDYMQDFMPATIKGQVGTLKEVANPFVSTILKTIALNRLNAFQRAKNTTISLLRDNFPDEITETKRITSDGKLTIFKTAPDRGGIQVLEDGKLNSYDVDPYIAESFVKMKAGDLNMLVSLLDKFNNKLFKPLVTTYNLGFALAFNPIRDIKRNYKSIPNANFIPISIGKTGIKIDTVHNLLLAYVKALPEAIKYSKGQLDTFTRQLVESKAINAPVNDFNFDARDDELGNILKRYGLLQTDEPLTNKTLEVVRKKLLKPVAQVLEGIRFIANTFEVISKIAGAQVRIAGGESGKQLAYNVRNYTGTPNYKVRGNQTATTNAIFVFSNIMKEGLKADFKIATDPKTASGYWWKTVKVDLLPKFLMFLGGAGVLGVGIKKWFDKVSEYDKSNYLIIPLGTDSTGKATYMRVPHDETGRLISVAFWKMANFIKDGKSSELQDIFSLGAGQLPSVTPAITILTNWTQYLSGRNPYDAFHGRTLIDDTTWQAGGGASLKKMVQWTTNTLGFSKFATYDTSKQTGVETFMQVAPFFSSVVKISDYGLQEQLKAVSADAIQKKAQETLIERDAVQKYVTQATKDGKLSMFSVSKYGNQAVKEVLGHMPQSKDEQNIADRIIQRFKVSTKKNLADDPRYVNLLYATSNDEKKAILKSIKNDSTTEEYAHIRNDLLQLKIVTPAVLYSVN